MAFLPLFYFCGSLSIRRPSVRKTFLRLLRHRHHVAVEIGDDPDGTGDDEKDDQHAKSESEDIVRAVGTAAQMQKEDEMDADLRQSEDDQPDRDTRGPQQMGLSPAERSDRRNDSEPQPHSV